MKLFLPGPMSVREEVLKQFEKPVIGHRTKEASEIQKSITINMQKVFGTKEEILLATSSGTGLMEGAIRSCTKKRALICSIGTFGDLWQRLGLENGKDLIGEKVNVVVTSALQTSAGKMIFAKLKN